MKRAGLFLLWLSLAVVAGRAQTTGSDGDFKVALPVHQGQLMWHADGFKITQSSAKPNGAEIGLRGTNGPGRLTFLGFLFLFPEQAPMTSAKCRDGVMEPAKKEIPTLKVLSTSEVKRSDGPPIELVNYSTQSRDGKAVYNMRGFLATTDICGDLEVYSDAPINPEDPGLKKLWASYRLEPDYAPQFSDTFLYAQILYQNQMYPAAAPIFEQALTKLKSYGGKDREMWLRVTTDQAGMSYGIAGNIPKARAVFEAAITMDPDYPLYYYNLACADAEEYKLADARTHLQQAFARKANVISGESMPDPTKDDSFLPYRTNKEFWSFLETLR
jgi:hypothetical protein